MTTHARARGAENPAARTIAPAVDIFENEHELLLRADLPGVPSDAVRIHLEPEHLVFEATRPAPQGGDGAPALQYRRAFTVAPIFDVEKVTARLERGVLLLTLPKLAAIKPRQIPVTSA